MTKGTNDIAIIGMSGVFPDAENLQDFYHNLCSGKDSVREPSGDRLRYCSIDPNKDYKIAGHLSRIDQFDHQFFNISKKEAEFIEPSQRIALQLACMTIENAGYALEDFRGSNTGIYISSASLFPMVYLQNINAVVEEKDPTIHTGTLGSMIFGRIAYELQLTGPAVMIDTGCSSSLIAINEAVEKLSNNKLDYALVGAISLKALFFEKGKGTGHLQAASLTGKTRAFDADADGIGIGEGGGLLLLKRADKARADKDHIHALIKGVGMSQDGGRSNSITAPSPAAQTQAIVQAWENAGIEPESIRYVETHGAGTPLGDMIEFQSLTDAFSQYSDKKGFCAISSIKSNIGHLGNAAGIAGIIKAVLSLQNKVHFPTLHFNTPNPYIDFGNSAAFVNAELREWPAHPEWPRRCGVSSFGLSGTNAHVVLEEAAATEWPADEGTPADVFFLKASARSLPALQQYCQSLYNFISTSGLPLSSILYTLNKGRSDHRLRVSITAADKADLLRQLEALAADPSGAAATVRQKQARVVLLMATSEVPEGRLRQLMQQYPVIREAAGSVIEAAGGALTPGQEAFALQYGLYRQCLAYGIPVRTIMGAGPGGLVNRYINGSLPLNEALDALREPLSPVSPVNIDKFLEKVKELQRTEPSIFVQAGPDGAFTAGIPAMQADGVRTERFGCDEDHLLESLGRLYAEGVSISWEKYYEGRTEPRIETPVYPFEKTRCWYDAPFKDIVDGVEKWFYQPGWTAAAPGDNLQAFPAGCYLLFCDPEGLYEEVEKTLGPGNRFIRVWSGKEFQGNPEQGYTAPVHTREGMDLLRNSLVEVNLEPIGMVYLNASTTPYALSAANCNEQLQREFLPLYRACQSFELLLRKPGFRLVTVTANAFAVNGKELTVLPMRGMLCGLVRSLLSEYPALQITSLDVEYGEETPKVLAQRLLDEACQNGLIRQTAYRSKSRYLPTLGAPAFDGGALQQRFSLKEGGIYLITGGGSGIGLETAKMLAEEGRSTLLIIGRSQLPEPVRRMKAEGIAVEYYVGDVNDLPRMQEIMSLIREKYGKLDGVVHAAGTGSAGIPVAMRRDEDLWATLNPKVRGTVILEQLTRPVNSGFFLLFSSAGSIVPARNCADYTSANAFEDAFAHYLRLQGRSCVAINWADWKDTGLQYRKKLSRSREENEAREKYVAGIGNAEGLAAIKCALVLDKPQMVVVKADLGTLRINPYFLLETGAEVTACAGACAGAASAPAAEVADVAETASSRKNLSTQERVAALWYEVLRTDNIDPDDDFYEIGGHSLNIMQLINALKKEFGIEIGLEEMLYNSTIRKLGVRVDELLFNEDVAKYEPILPVAPAEDYEISHAQRRFWLLHQLEGREAYNVPMAFSLKGALDAGSLQQAFRAIVERHESLRTGLVLVNREPRQKINSMEALPVALEYRSLPDGYPDDAIRELIEKEAGRPFDLEHPPLIRGLLVRKTPVDHILCITLHHIVADARSIAIIKKELLQYYDSLQKGIPVGWQPLPVQYKDFAAWQNNQLAGASFETHRKYWSQRLQALSEAVKVRPDLAHPDASSFDADRVLFSLGPELVTSLKKLAERNNTTLFIVTLTIFKVLLHRVTGADDLVVATPVSGRQHGDLEDQVGIYLNTLLLRTRIDANDAFTTLLKQVKYDTAKDFEHQVYPFDLLAGEMQRQHSNTALFDIGFTWSLKAETAEPESTGLSIEEYATGFVKAKSSLWMLVSETPDDVHCSLVFKTALYRRQTIQLLRDRFLLLAEQTVSGYAKKIKELHVRLQEEQALESRKLDVNFSF